MKDLKQYICITTILFALLMTTACKSTLVNMAFNKLGIYDECIQLETISNGEKDIVFFPMHHIGTPNFYQDVSNKVDSLLEKGYHFYKEKVIMENEKDTLLMFKAVKFQGFPYKKGGYSELVDSMMLKKFNYTPKKKLVNQTSYEDLSLNNENSSFTDPFLENIIAYYELNAGEIPINDCDLEKGIFNFFDECPKYEPNKVWRDKAMNDFRNHRLINLINKSHFDKIAIIYGARHVNSVKDSLLNQGYVIK